MMTLDDLKKRKPPFTISGLIVNGYVSKSGVKIAQMDVNYLGHFSSFKEVKKYLKLNDVVYPCAFSMMIDDDMRWFYIVKKSFDRIFRVNAYYDPNMDLPELDY